jgi:hypothetical protein
MDSAEPFKPFHVAFTFADCNILDGIEELQNRGEQHVFRATDPDQGALLDKFTRSLPVGLKALSLDTADDEFPRGLTKLWRGVLDDDYDSPNKPFTVPTHDGGESTFTPMELLQLRGMRRSDDELEAERKAKRAHETDTEERAAKRRRVEPFLGSLDRSTLKGNYAVVIVANGREKK